MRTSQEFKHSGATELVESLPGIPRDERIVTEDPASPSSKQKSREAISGELENDASILLMKKRGGPRTSMGKARSRRNALKHGILSIAVFVEDETRSQYELLSRRLYRDFRPKGMFEEILVEKLVTVIWRYRRLLQAEAAMVQEQIRTAEELKKQNIRLSTTTQI